MGRVDRILTETYRDKRYEEDLTKLYFRVMQQIGQSRTTPCIEYARIAFSAATEFVEAVVYSRTHLERYQDKVQPVLKDIELILYGDPRLPSVQAVAARYDARVFLSLNKPELQNGLKVINQLGQIVFLVKQWAYEQGLLLPKPLERKYGIDGMADVLEQ
jgi:hypothetical protein